MNNIFKELLQEANRRDLITKGRRGDNYVITNQAKGKNRFERKKYSSVYRNVAQFNNIDMNLLFKQDILLVGVKVVGETDEYIVKMKFKGVLKELQEEVKRNKDKLEFKCIQRALMTVFNKEEVFISCSCPDWRYRFAYFSSKNDYNSGPIETRVSKITNPNDTKGSGCKHSLLVLANMDWLIKVTSVINNYIKYARNNMQRLYADYIFPKVYGVEYQKAVQLSLFDTDDFDSSPYTIDDINKIGRTSGRFQKGNPYRFQKKEEPIEDKTNPLGLRFNRDEVDSTEEEETPTIEKQ